MSLVKVEVMGFLWIFEAYNGICIDYVQCICKGLGTFLKKGGDC